MSLVARTCGIARQLPWIDQVLVSTDDAEIASEAREAGFEVPWMRPSELAGDATPSVDVWAHALSRAEETAARPFDVSVLLEPTCPLRRPADVEACVDALLSTEAEAAVTISPSPPRYHPLKAISLGDGDLVELPADRPQRRQDLQGVFHTNGACYAARRRAILELGEVMPARETIGIVLDRPFVDIDSLADLELAEWYLRRGS